MKTDGQRQLAEIAKHRDGGQTEIAKNIGVTPSCVSLWCSGRTRPDPVQRAKLRKHLAIAETDWLTTKERAEIAGTVPEKGAA